jgi:RHS repeat-associated protein
LRKRDGSVLTYSYDAPNRMIVKTVPERTSGAQALTAAQTRDVHYSYDLRNLQLSARFDSPTGEGIANAYDGFGRLTSSSNSTGGVTRTLTYQYDAAGNRTRITHPDGFWSATTYDALNRPNYFDANGIGQIYAYYLPHGGFQGVGRANGTSSGYAHDGLQRLQGRVDYFVGTNNDVYRQWSYNAAGQLSSQYREIIGSQADPYAWTGHYAVNRAYTTNGLNQYSAAGSATFGYDANGNLTSDGARTYVYDIENRLVSSSSGAALVYDPLGRLFQVTGTVAGITSTTRFVYDGDALVAEYDGSNNLTRRHLHWVGADVPMVTFQGAGLTAPRYLYTDHQGSIVAATDGAGVPAVINSYDEYGIPGAGNAGRFQYTGQVWLDELGMYYYKARIYSPTLGRFLQTDSVGYADQFNLYAYIGNDPVNGTDSSGQDRVTCNVVVDLDQASASCTAAADESPRTSVVYNATRYFVDAYGRTESTTSTMSQVIEGSISQEGFLSRRLLGVGDQIKATIDRNLSNIAGADLRPFTSPTNLGSSGGSSFAGTPAGGPSGYSPARINGRDYSGHARSRMAERDVAPIEVENAVRRGTSRPGSDPGTTAYHDPSTRVTAVLNNSTGRVVTVWKGRP